MWSHLRSVTSLSDWRADCPGFPAGSSLSLKLADNNSCLHLHFLPPCRFRVEQVPQMIVWGPLRKACPVQDPFLSQLRFITCPTGMPAGNRRSRRVGLVLLRLQTAAGQLCSSHLTPLNFHLKSKGKLFARLWTLWNYSLPEAQPSCQNGMHATQLKVQEHPESFRKTLDAGAHTMSSGLCPTFSAFFCTGLHSQAATGVGLWWG